LQRFDHVFGVGLTFGLDHTGQVNQRSMALLVLDARTPIDHHDQYTSKIGKTEEFEKYTPAPPGPLLVEH
jgi:hypothetical protein